jgi:hypothetical protein
MARAADLLQRPCRQPWGKSRHHPRCRVPQEVRSELSNKWYDVMTSISAEITNEPSWRLYADYCKARANNPCDNSLIVVEQFVEVAQGWSFEEKKRFSLWLMNSAGRIMERFGRSKYESRAATGGPGIFAPRIVVWAILLPTLVEWRRKEPTNPEPHFWLALYDHNEHPARNLREAIRLDPDYGPARLALAQHILKYIEYNQHELPSGYLGDPADDLIALSEALVLVAESVEPPIRARLEEQILLRRAIAEDWGRLSGQLKGLDWNARTAIWRSR